MDNLILVGLSHKTAPIQVREQIAFSEEAIETALNTLTEDLGLRETLILSTCNRVEVIAESPNRKEAVQNLKEFLYRFHGVGDSVLDEYLYSLHQTEAVRHVFRVASSLDSMVVGEPQILFQLKEAFRKADSAGCIGRNLNSLVPKAFSVAKRIRSETRIAVSAVSVSSVAVELAEKIFGNLSGKTILMLGAGKMGELAGRSLVDSGISNVFVTNRTPAKAEQLAERFRGSSVPFDEMEEYLAKADIVLVSTGSRDYILNRTLLKPVLKKRRYQPLFIIDISVPRNVDPLVNEMENIFLYDIDDLQSVIESNLDERKREAEVAEQIVEEEVAKFFQRLSSNQLGPLISQLRTQVEELCLEDLKKGRNGLDPENYAQLERMLLRAAHKVAHPMIVTLKQAQQRSGQQIERIQMIRQIFSLDNDNE